MNFEQDRNGTTSAEALDAFREIIFLTERGEGPRSDLGEYRMNKQIIDRYIGSLSAKINRWVSKLGEYTSFSKWAYTQLGYKFIIHMGIRDWWNVERKQERSRFLEAYTEARSQLPDWCQSDREVQALARKLLASV